MNVKLCALICALLILETQCFPDKRADRRGKGKRPSATNFLKRVLENVFKRAMKGLATPGDKEILKYLSNVPFLKDRICGKISTTSMEHSKSTLPTTRATESLAPTTLTFLEPSTRKRISETARGTTQGITRGATRVTKRKSNSPKIPTSSSTKRRPKMMFVDVVSDVSDTDERDEIEVVRKLSVSEENSVTHPKMPPTIKRQTDSGKLPKKTAARPSQRGTRPKLKASNRPKNAVKAHKPSSGSHSAEKQSSLVESDLMDTVVYVRRKRDLRNEESRETDESTEVFNQHDSWRNEEPSEEGNPLETRDDDSLNDKELVAIVGEENPESSFDSRDFENGNKPTGGETRNIDIETKDFENTDHETIDTFNATEDNEKSQKKENVGESVDEERGQTLPMLRKK